MPANIFPTQDQGFQAIVKVDNVIHLVLRVTYTATGPMVGIYDAKTGKWWRDRPMVEDWAEGKARAESMARSFVTAVNPKLQFPTLDWQETGGAATAASS